MKEKIELILVKHDPVKLIKMGAPQDEYDSEAKMIWERTTRHFSQEKIHDIVYEVFLIQFAGRKSIIGEFDSYKVIAQEIKELLDQKGIRAS